MTLLPHNLASFYCRLHRKIVSPGHLFDPSWDCDGANEGDRILWAGRLLHAETATDQSPPLFSTLIERLILLTPSELQRLLCATVVLSRREEFRHCIDGNKLRILRDTIGSKGLDAILQSRTAVDSPGIESETDWNIVSLCGEAYSHICSFHEGQSTVVLDILKIGLPKTISVKPSSCDEKTFESLVRESHKWYPEFRWLFG
jgi:hypothetical protein